MKPVGIVQHEPSVPPGVITDVLHDSDRDFVVIEAWRDADWPATTDLSAVVVLGGTVNVDQLDVFPFLKQGRDLMADAIEKELPTLGVCLGSQMMARVLGAEVRRASPRNALFSRLELTEEGAVDPLVNHFADVEVLQFHEDTFDVPHDAVSLANSATTGLAQAFRHGERAYGIQFHFEVDQRIVDAWLHNIGRRAMLDQWGVRADEFSRSARSRVAAQRAAGAELTRRFLDLAVPA